jgi:hypothetical protein
MTIGFDFTGRTVIVTDDDWNAVLAPRPTWCLPSPTTNGRFYPGCRLAHLKEAATVGGCSGCS